MNKIIISGYYGFENLGDEAVLAGILHSLRLKGKNLEITVLSNNPDLTQKRYGVKAVNRTDLIKIIKTIKDSDLFISGGGSLLQDVTGWKSIPYYLGLTYIAQFFKKNTIFYAQGIGPVKNKIFRKMIRFGAERVDLITVRDEKSIKFLNTIGIQISKIRKTVDPVFSFTKDYIKSYPETNKNHKKCNKTDKMILIDKKNNTKPVIGISVRPWNFDYLSLLSKVVSDFAKKIEADILIIPFHKDEDRDISRKFQKKLSLPSQIVTDKNNPEEMLYLFSKLDFVIGVRLHSLIFAAVNHIPFFGISYDPKIDGFINTLGLENYIKLQNINYNKLKKDMFFNWKQRKKIKNVLKAKEKIFQEEALFNSKLVLDLLN